MAGLKRIAALFLIATLAATTLTGCSSAKKDKSGAQEAAAGFLEGIKSGSKNEINKYSSGEGTTGEFVKLYDADSFEEDLLEALGDTNLSEETQKELDEFYAGYSSMMEEYQITDVVISDNGSATAYVTVKNSFPFDVTKSETTKNRVSEALAKYQEDNQEELEKIAAEQGEEAELEKVRNDTVIIILNTYEEAIALSEPVTYMLALTLNKNEELGSWYVSDVQSYDSSIAGTGAHAKETDTSATEVSVEFEPTTETTEPEAEEGNN
jgi:hypothetical protein